MNWAAICRGRIISHLRVHHARGSTILQDGTDTIKDDMHSLSRKKSVGAWLWPIRGRSHRTDPGALRGLNCFSAGLKIRPRAASAGAVRILYCTIAVQQVRLNRRQEHRHPILRDSRKSLLHTRSHCDTVSGVISRYHNSNKAACSPGSRHLGTRKKMCPRLPRYDSLVRELPF